jgi:N-acetylglucosaminyl-diphospho-decaprenol L-rhamnosyltransferase
VNVAVVTIVHARHEHLSRQARSLMAGTRAPDQYVVVAMNDSGVASRLGHGGLEPRVVDLTTGGAELPLASARNVGVQAAIDDGADALILLDVDCLAGRELVDGYVEALTTQPQTIWSGPVTYLPPATTSGYDLDRLTDIDDPHPARPAPAPGTFVHSADPDLFWSLSFAIHVETWRKVGGFCEDYAGYGGEDTDFARLATACGVPLGWAGTPRAYHQYHPGADPPVQHAESILRNARLFHRRWGTWPMEGWLEEFARLGLVARTSDGWIACRPPERQDVPAVRASPCATGVPKT